MTVREPGLIRLRPVTLISYFGGCSLASTTSEYDERARLSAHIDSHKRAVASVYTRTFRTHLRVEPQITGVLLLALQLALSLQKERVVVFVLQPSRWRMARVRHASGSASSRSFARRSEPMCQCASRELAASFNAAQNLNFRVNAMKTYFGEVL